MTNADVPTPALLRRPAPRTGEPDATQFGRVEDDGTVVLIAPEGEVVVGQWAAGDPAEGLRFFARRYEDLVVETDLVNQRLRDGKASAEQAQAALVRIREGLDARAFVGDVAALTARCDALSEAIDVSRIAQRERRAEQREAALARRRALVDEAESLSESTSWKTTTERYAAIVEEWRALPRSDRTGEQELWQRISAARTTFDKRRRAHFSAADAERKDAITRKRALIERAEALSTSTDWVVTSRALRDLMNEWKNAPRAPRTDEDKLWRRFKAAQDAFYTARGTAEAAEEEVLRANLPAKEGIVDEAERLLPIADARAARRSLRDLQDRFDRAGDLPKADRDRLDARLRKVDEAIRRSESQAWQSAGTGVANDAFAGALARLEEKRDAAAARGDSATARALDEQIASTRELLGGAARTR